MYQMKYSMKMTQMLSQSQMQFLQLLSMTNQELEQFLEEESMSNPMLERSESITVSYRFDDYGNKPNKKNNYNDNSIDPIFNIAQPEIVDIYKLFLEQLNEAEFSETQWKAALFCIDNLDDNGYFLFSHDEAAYRCGIDIGEFEYVIRRLQQLEPYGCFSSDLSECLLLQLKSRGVGDESMIAMVRDCMDDILKQRITAISKKLSVSNQYVRECIRYISTLNPKPLSAFMAGSSSYIIPDIVCAKDENEWTIGLNSSFYSSYGMNDYYCMMLHENPKSDTGVYLKNNYNKARMILANIEQRRNLLFKLTKLILEEQSCFLENGGQIKPFTMAAAAEKLQVSPSTITRAVKNKWIQCSGRTVLMKDLFTAGADTDQGYSADQIKSIIGSLIDEEDNNKPYSDNSLMEILNGRGIQISRRTVAKYRMEMGIMSCFDRKAYV